jgi:hypothetical protein
MEAQTDLQSPIVEGGIRSVNFFNGRMLTARDLTREQEGHREITRRLGRAVGEGVAYGLEVSKSTSPKSTPEFPLVTVEPGLAVNRRGQTLWLRDKTDVALVRKASPSAPGLIFSECLPLQSGTYVAGAGVYLLTVAPAETREGRAVTSTLNPGGAPCNTDALVWAVQFRLIQIDGLITQAELQDVNHLRNLIAYKCFGVADTQSFLKDPFGPEIEQHGLLDSLRPNLLTDCDVPLGVLYWTLSGGINFIDMWSVRRRLVSQSALVRWDNLLSEQRATEGEAMFQQFADQVNDILIAKAGSLAGVVATDYFASLPAVGVIPIGSAKPLQGFDPLKFFKGQTIRKAIFMEGTRVERLIRLSFSFPPIDLSSKKVIWLYFVRENFLAKDLGGAAMPYLVFSSGHLPYQADAHFDLSHWNYSNYTAFFA